MKNGFIYCLYLDKCLVIIWSETQFYVFTRLPPEELSGSNAEEVFFFYSFFILFLWFFFYNAAVRRGNKFLIVYPTTVGPRAFQNYDAGNIVTRL